MMSPKPTCKILQSFYVYVIINTLPDFPGKQQTIVMFPTERLQLNASFDWCYFIHPVKIIRTKMSGHDNQQRGN